jgi:hypothetical protein
MNRSRSLPFVVVLSMALVCAAFFAKPAMAQAPAPTATPEAPPQLITINAPARGQQISNPFNVSGVVALTPASKQMRYALRDSAGQLITQGLLNVAGEWNQAGVFTGSVSFGEQTLSGPAVLEVSAPDGRASIDVNIPPVFVQPIQGLSLSLNGIAGSAEATRTAGYINQRSWVDLDALPEHIRVTFDGITTTAQFDPRQKQILIIPLENYRAIFRNVQATIFNSTTVELQNVLATQPPALNEALPLLPTSDQSQAFYTAPRYIPFNGGKGVRYLTQFTQEITAATSSNLSYVYQGLSDDGRYLIAAYLPISTTAMPTSAAEITKDVRDAMKRDYKGYIAGVVSALDSAPQSFTPSLAALDATMGSIIIQDTLFPRPEPTPTPDPAAAPASITGTATELLNVRAGPSTRNRILDQIAAGGSMNLTGRTANGQWLRMALNDGRIGWVSARYVDVAGDATALPVVR